MTATELIDELKRRGVELRAEGEVIRYRPKSAVDHILLSELAVHKQELLSRLHVAEIDQSCRPAGALPPRPADRPGTRTELILRQGRWIWLQRPIDAAHMAWLTYLEAENNPVRPGAESRSCCGREPDRNENGLTAVERAEKWRAEWQVKGYPPGVRPKN